MYDKGECFQVVIEHRGVGVGSLYRISIIKIGNIPLSKVTKISCRPDEFKRASCRHVDFKKVPCRMSQKPKKARVAVSILGVYTPNTASVLYVREMYNSISSFSLDGFVLHRRPLEAQS